LVRNHIAALAAASAGKVGDSFRTFNLGLVCLSHGYLGLPVSWGKTLRFWIQNVRGKDLLWSKQPMTPDQEYRILWLDSPSATSSSEPCCNRLCAYSVPVSHSLFILNLYCSQIAGTGKRHMVCKVLQSIEGISRCSILMFLVLWLVDYYVQIILEYRRGSLTTYPVSIRGLQYW
jgi:hypothetical protein